MNAAIELHDSDLAAVVHDGASVILSLSPAYVHRSGGTPGVDAGTGWTQTAIFIFADANVSPSPGLPGEVAGGWLHVGDVRYDNLVPAAGVFAMPCELRLELCQQPESLLVRGTCLTIALHGRPMFIEATS